MEREAGFKYRVYPNAEQRQTLARTFGCVRFVYNWGLRLRSDAYHDAGQTLRYGDTSAALTTLKKQDETAWLNEVSSVPLQQTLRHLERAYTTFFQGQTGFPSFKRKHGPQSAEYTKSAYRLVDSGARGQPVVTLAKMKTPLKIRWSRPLPSAPKTITVSRDAAGRYFVSFRCTINPTTLPPTTKAVGVDLGLTDVVVTSDGWKSGNPRHLSRSLAKLKREQRHLSRKQKGSKRRNRQRQKVARIHARIADQRRDYLHKLTTRLVREYDVICIESLRVKNMMRNHCLARGIGDASWGELVRQLRYKTEWYGHTLVELDTFYPSSKRCSACGKVAPSLPLSVRHWTCAECGAIHDRDVNAACNLQAAGLAVFARGAGVRPASDSSGEAFRAEARILPL